MIIVVVTIDSDKFVVFLIPRALCEVVVIVCASNSLFDSSYLSIKAGVSLKLCACSQLDACICEPTTECHAIFDRREIINSIFRSKLATRSNSIITKFITILIEIGNLQVSNILTSLSLDIRSILCTDDGKSSWFSRVVYPCSHATIMIATRSLNIYRANLFFAILNNSIGIAILATTESELHRTINFYNHLEVVQSVSITTWSTLKSSYTLRQSFRHCCDILEVKFKVLECASHILYELYLAEHTLGRSITSDIHTSNSFVEINNNLFWSLSCSGSSNQFALYRLATFHSTTANINLKLRSALTITDNELKLTSNSSLLKISIA